MYHLTWLIMQFRLNGSRIQSACDAYTELTHVHLV